MKIIEGRNSQVCKICLKEKQITDFYKSRKFRANNRIDWHTHGRCKECSKIWYKRWYEKNGHRGMRDKHYKVKYGISLKEYEVMYLKVSGSCEICGKKMKILAVDHNHLNDNVRGLLCTSCNLGLGMFRDSLELLDSAKKYLTKSNL